MGCSRSNEHTWLAMKYQDNGHAYLGLEVLYTTPQTLRLCVLLVASPDRTKRTMCNQPMCPRRLQELAAGRSQPASVVSLADAFENLQLSASPTGTNQEQRAFVQHCMESKGIHLLQGTTPSPKSSTPTYCTRRHCAPNTYT